LSDKRYYWLRLYDDFFDSLRIKKLRRLAGGDTFTIIYLKLQLVAMKHDGVINFKGVETDLTSELALELNEDADNVKLTLAYLISYGLAETSDDAVFLPYAVANVGSETASAQRVRDCRAKQKALQCNTTVTEVKRDCSVEIEIEKEKEKEKENVKKKKFVPPTLDEVKAYVESRNSGVDPERFFAYYNAGEWRDMQGNPVRNWKQKLITWERKNDGERMARKSSPRSRANKKDWNIVYD